MVAARRETSVREFVFIEYEDTATLRFAGICGGADSTTCSLLRASASSRLDERIAHVEARKRAEVAIRRPKLTHAMRDAEGGDARVVNFRADRA